MEEKAVGMKPAVLDMVREALKGKLQVIERAMQVVGDDELLQVKPETLDGIKEGAVLGQPDDMDTVGKHAESSPGDSGTVIGGVVHDQDQLLMGEFGEQVLQEGDEGIRYLRVAVVVDT